MSLGSRLYRYHFKIHEKTGVLQAYLDNGIHNTLQSEPNHIVVRGEIGSDLKTRKRGVWDYATPEDEKKSLYSINVYFTCPWCGTIGKTEISRSYLETAYADSLWCGMRVNRIGRMDKLPIGCHRHLTLTYREPGKEKEGFHVQ